MDRITLSNVRLKYEKERWVYAGPFDNELYPDLPKKFVPYMERGYLGVDDDGSPVSFSVIGIKLTEGCRVNLDYGSGFWNWLIWSKTLLIGDKKYSLTRLEELPPE